MHLIQQFYCRDFYPTHPNSFDYSKSIQEFDLVRKLNKNIRCFSRTENENVEITFTTVFVDDIYQAIEEGQQLTMCLLLVAII